MTPLHRDPKQQELRIHLRPRLIKDPKNGLKIWARQSIKKRFEQTLALHYRSAKVFKKLLVLHYRSEKVLKNRWLDNIGPKK